jgi:hypothetical protein
MEFGEDGEHPEHRAAFGCRGVDALLDHVQPHAALAQFGAEGHEVQHRTAEAVQPGDLSVSPSRSMRRTMSSCGRLTLAPPAWST